ncbi:MAG: thiol oxidoreductase [Myxococcales bacterium]|nr:thiol oxidoreductase [Myxococcales bacterium]
MQRVRFGDQRREGLIFASVKKWLKFAGTTSALLLLVCCLGDGKERAELESGEWLPGGETTNTLLLGVNAYVRPAENISEDHALNFFFSGNAFFNQPWVEAPASTANRDGLGPVFNARSCSGCHPKDGRGKPPDGPDEDFAALLIRLSRPGKGERGEPLPDLVYGHQLQNQGIPEVPAEARPRVHYEEIKGQYPDGSTYTLLKPIYRLLEPAYGAVDETTRLSARVAPGVYGVGLLDAIPNERLKALEDPDDADEDGISGRINWVWDQRGERHAPGRFGWKGEHPTVYQQTVAAFNGDLGITTIDALKDDCSAAQIECLDAPHGGEPEIRYELLEKVVNYTRLLAVPMRQRYEDPDVLRGKWLFTAAGCASCHVPRHTTAKIDDLPELSEQEIWPYTDLLLHDMGPELSDQHEVFDASGSEWRTPALWGISYLKAVNKHERLLHDGRARGIEEAILWHGGEADGARQYFKNLSAEDRQYLLKFVGSL